jgi:hypothetical protein
MSDYYFGKYTMTALNMVAGVVLPDTEQNQPTPQSAPHLSGAQRMIDDEDKIERMMAALKLKKQRAVDAQVTDIKKQKRLAAAEEQMRGDVLLQLAKDRLAEEKEQDDEDERILMEIMLRRSLKK